MLGAFDAILSNVQIFLGLLPRKFHEKCGSMGHGSAHVKSNPNICTIANPTIQVLLKSTTQHVLKGEFLLLLALVTFIFRYS